MKWKDIAGKIMGVAPMVGTLLGGPLGGAAGGLISLLGGALGLSPEETTPTKISTLLSSDPSALLKLKELENTHQVELQKLVLDQERMRLADVSDARSREVETTKATGTRDYNLYILAWVVVIGFYSLCTTLIFIALPEGSSDIIFMLFGTLSTGFGMVLQYFFGSSRSSADKTRLLVKK